MAFMLRQVLQPTSPKLVTDHSKAGKKVGDNTEKDFDEYDFVIVGGGTSGCVLAARLSEDPSVRVLVLEAGGSGKALMFTRIPMAFSLLFRSKHVHQLYTEPQTKAQEKRKFWPRAKMLGGCSSINAQMAQYGAPQDFNNWGKIIGDEAWSWKNFGKYFQKFENYQEDSRFPDVKMDVKGTKGPVRVGYHGEIQDCSKDFIQACMKMGVPFSPDFNTDAGPEGVNRLMTYMDENRVRVSSEAAYLTAEVLARPNLTVVIEATVTKLLFKHEGEQTRAVGVEFAKKRGSQLYTVRAKKEVILSAGSIQSPHLLMLSGVGPAEHLKSKNIPVVRDMPGVGAHLTDHPVIDMSYKNKLNNSVKYANPKSIFDIPNFLGALYKYLVHKRGPLTGNVGEAAAFIRSDDSSIIPEDSLQNKARGGNSGDTRPDIEIFISALAYKDHAQYIYPMHSLAVHCCLVRPLSTGSLTLKTSNPFDLPLVDPGYLTAPEDMTAIRRGLRFIMKVVQQEPLLNHIDHRYKHKLVDSNLAIDVPDGELEEIIRERIETLYHPTSTCRMAPEADNGVVDSHLRVYGIQGLRVADAAIFPEIVTGHTAAACLAVGEHAADILKTEYNLKSKEA